MNQPKTSHSIFNIAVIVAALGYFVDIYDLLLFAIVRIESLRSLGLSPEQITIEGEAILAMANDWVVDWRYHCWCDCR